MLRLRAATAATVLVLLSGCVGKLAITPNRTVSELDMARQGTSYALPKIQYDVKLTRTLAECPGEFVNNDPAKPTALKFAVSATAALTYVAGESYDIDYSKLPGWMRTASFDMKLYPNGTLKSLGASAEDRTAETIGGLVKTALSVATVLAAAPFVDTAKAPKPGTDQMIGCTAAARAMVHEVDDLDKRLKQSKQKLEALQAQAEYFKTAGTARVLNASGRNQFLKLLNDLLNEEKKLAGLKERRELLVGKLSVTESFTWSGGVTARPEIDEHPLSAAHTDKLAGLVERIGLPRAARIDPADMERRELLPECYGADSNETVCLQKQLGLRAGVHRHRDLTPCRDDAFDECLTKLPSDDKTLIAARDAKPDSGIFIREAMEGQLLFCREISLKAAAARATQDAVVTEDGVAAPGQATGADGAAPSDRGEAANGAQSADGTGGGSLNGQSTAGSPGGFLNGQGSVGTQGGSLNGQNRTGTSRAGRTDQAGAQAPKPELICDLAHDEAKLASANFPQYGQLRFLPFRVGTFQAREMTLSMTETGRLDSFTYKSTKAPGERLATLSADVASQLAAFREARETERRDDVKYERESALAEIQGQIDTLTKEAALKKLQSPPVDPLQPMKDETAAIEAEIALLKAKAERLKAAAALGLGG